MGPKESEALKSDTVEELINFVNKTTWLNRSEAYDPLIHFYQQGNAARVINRRAVSRLHKAEKRGNTRTSSKLDVTEMREIMKAAAKTYNACDETRSIRSNSTTFSGKSKIMEA